MGKVETIPARSGRGVRVKKGQKIKVINTHGTQVVDTWAFNSENLREFMSMEHCRVWVQNYRVHRGDALVTNKRRPILKWIEDTSPGVHERKRYTSGSSPEHPVTTFGSPARSDVNIPVWIFA